jgi:hypothetical protein
MGFVKSLMGFGGVEKVGNRIVEELEAARTRGEEQLVVGYTQSEIGVRANATQMAVFIRRKIEKSGFEVIDGEGGSFGADVQMLVRWKPAQSATPPSTTVAPQENGPDMERFHRMMKAVDEAPPAGKQGNGMASSEIETIRTWMADRFVAEDYEAVWHRRLELGLGLSGENVEMETWFWVNALPALAALRLGAKDHPLVATSAGYADQACRHLPDPDDQIQGAMSEINERFFG